MSNNQTYWFYKWPLKTRIILCVILFPIFIPVVVWPKLKISMWFKIALVFAWTMGLLIIGNLPTDEVSTTDNMVSDVMEESSKTVERERVVEIPDYSLFNTEKNDVLSKFSTDVTIKTEITENQIELVANEIKSDNTGFDRYFIVYYLDDMDVERAGWATSHFNPDLDISILGLTKEELNNLSQITTKDDFEGDIISQWKVNIPNSIITLTQDGNNYTVYQTYDDGSESSKDIQLIGDKYVYENDFGEYYKINSDGKLEHYSENGKFATYPEV